MSPLSPYDTEKLIESKSILSNKLIVHPTYEKNTISTVNKKRKIVDSVAFREDLDKIIERDFFPEVKDLRKTGHYINSLSTEENQIDVPGSLRKTIDNVQYLETPEHMLEQMNSETGEKLPNLDKYLSKNIHEDCESFNEVVVKENKEIMDQFESHFYDKEKIYKKLKDDSKKLLTSHEQMQLASLRRPEQDSWNYTNKNNLMFIPDGFTQDVCCAKRNIIQHNNTSVHKLFLDDVSDMSKIDQTSLNMKDRIGPDGQSIITGSTPIVRGYKYVHVDEVSKCNQTPLMTWGEICGTPLNLDHDLNSPSFKIHQLPERDRLLQQLTHRKPADKKSNKIRQLQMIHKRMKTPYSKTNEHADNSGTIINTPYKKSPYIVKRRLDSIQNLEKKNAHLELTPQKYEKKHNITDSLLKIKEVPKAEDYF
ncbi:hypothetical protein A3Q56_05709 [Intoshia linei]|uniref:Uncharacterized protein n=1 Tax=Intoshia linei TaxID=1819745 RepID=A0A177AX12_9BILA|nr:hypothetical protein A3Q56_05709 [Intoshia linei]